MKIQYYYIQRELDRLKTKIIYDKNSEGRPAWIYIEGLPKGVNFIMANLGKNVKEGQRIQYYKTYLPEGLFLPIDYNNDEMKKFYDKFSEIYDKELKSNKQNLEAGKFLSEKLKKYSRKDISILDLGAGTGLISEIYIDNGFKNITLVDYSRKMLNKAKSRKKLKNCKFIYCDIKKLDLKRKYDIVISNFSFGNPSYFTLKYLREAIKVVKKHMKPNSIIAIIGPFNRNIIENEFKKLESGIYTLNRNRKQYTDFFIGSKN